MFVDVNAKLVEAISERGEYVIEIAEPAGCSILKVRNVRAIPAEDEQEIAQELGSCDLVSTSVGANALPSAARTLARALENRAAWRPEDPLDVLICENLPDAAARMRGWMDEAASPLVHRFIRERVGLVETVVSRMIPVPSPEQVKLDPLFIRVEAYDRLPVDRLAFRGPIPRIQGLEPSDRIKALEARKLYCHNCGHALVAYFGYLKGYETIAAALADRALAGRVRAGMEESGRALAAEFGFDPAEMKRHIEDLLRRFANPALGDTTVRVGRDPIRKLGRQERLVGAALLCVRHGIEPEALCEGIRAALRFDPLVDDGARALQAMLKAGGTQAVLRKVCGLTESDPLWSRLAGAR